MLSFLYTRVYSCVDLRVGFVEIAMVRDLRIDRAMPHFLGDGWRLDARLLQERCHAFAGRFHREELGRGRVNALIFEEMSYVNTNTTIGHVGGDRLSRLGGDEYEVVGLGAFFYALAEQGAYSGWRALEPLTQWMIG